MSRLFEVSMAHMYRKYLRLLEKWPVDPSKKSRDLGQHIREQVKINFSKPDCPVMQNEEECTNIYDSLNRIADNSYKNVFERTFNSSATGLTAEQCRGVLSDDFMQYLKEDNSSLLSRIFNRGR